MIQYRLQAKGNTFKTLQSPSSTSDASTKPFKRTRSVHSKSLTIQLDQILWTCTNASLRCHLSTTNRSSFASAVNESLHRLHCFHGLHRFHCLHGLHGLGALHGCLGCHDGCWVEWLSGWKSWAAGEWLPVTGILTQKNGL